MSTPNMVLDFWFRDAGPEKWFANDPDFDRDVAGRFKQTWEIAAEGHYDDWLDSPDGALALIIVLDQFPLNMFRGEDISLSTLPKAIEAANEAIRLGHDKAQEDMRRRFMYLPFMHSEDIEDQKRCVKLYEEAGDAEGVAYALKHLEIVEQFGRFPNRNAWLGRQSTPEEIVFLESWEGF